MNFSTTCMSDLKLVQKPLFPEHLTYLSLIKHGCLYNCWLCYDNEIGATTFVKHTTRDKDNVHNLEKEATILNSLDSKYFSKLHGLYFLNKGEQAVLSLEYFEGETIDNLNPLPEKTFIIKEVLSALGELHHLRMIHNDIKPENIFLTKLGQVKLLDLETSVCFGDPAPYTDLNFQTKDVRCADFGHDFYSLMKTVEALWV